MKIADLDLINSSRMTLIHFKLKILHCSKGAAASPEMLGGAFWQVYFMISEDDDTVLVRSQMALCRAWGSKSKNQVIVNRSLLIISPLR